MEDVAAGQAELALEIDGGHHLHAWPPVGVAGQHLAERLRERDLGQLDGLTGQGIRARFPDEAERRSHVGKLYYQPPSGESWADVVLRVRSLLSDLREGHDGARVWLVTHQAVIMAFRYALEGLDERELLEIDRTTPIPNASLTRYVRRDRGLLLDVFADDGLKADGLRPIVTADDLWADEMVERIAARLGFSGELAAAVGS